MGRAEHEPGRGRITWAWSSRGSTARPRPACGLCRRRLRAPRSCGRLGTSVTGQIVGHVGHGPELIGTRSRAGADRASRQRCAGGCGRAPGGLGRRSEPSSAAQAGSVVPRRGRPRRRRRASGLAVCLSPVAIDGALVLDEIRVGALVVVMEDQPLAAFGELDEGFDAGHIDRWTRPVFGRGIDRDDQVSVLGLDAARPRRPAGSAVAALASTTYARGREQETKQRDPPERGDRDRLAEDSERIRGCGGGRDRLALVRREATLRGAGRSRAGAGVSAAAGSAAGSVSVRSWF